VTYAETSDVELAVRRCCCPVCFRRGRDVTVGFAVEGHGLYPLTRRPRQDERPWEGEVALGMLYWQHAVGASYVSETGLRPPIWPGSSTRMPEELARAAGPVVTCRYGHRLRVLPTADLDRILRRIGNNDAIYLASVR